MHHLIIFPKRKSNESGEKKIESMTNTFPDDDENRKAMAGWTYPYGYISVCHPGKWQIVGRREERRDCLRMGPEGRSGEHFA
jgi:hypothetical protein